MNVADIEVSEHRQPEHDIESLFVERWSPRAMTGEVVSEYELRRLFAAARWAPSSFNEQPWRFFWARRDTGHWPLFVGFLNEFNAKWATEAGALLVVTSKTKFSRNGKDNPVHQFDAGAAWVQLALQASTMGLVTHGMAGIHYDQIPSALHLDDDMEVHCMVAVGYPGEVESLPEGLREKESPSGRKSVDEISHEGPL